MKYYRLFIILFMMNVAFAAQIKMVDTKQHIENLDNAISQSHAKIHYTQSFSDKPLATKSFIAFPKKIPQSSSKMFASFELTNSNATIYVNSSENCKGEKFCNLGKLTFESNGNPTIFYDRANKLATTPVTLKNHIQGFYTRGYAMADYSPANIQWRDKEILYTLTWNIEDKIIFTEMANSVISQLR